MELGEIEKHVIGRLSTSEGLLFSAFIAVTRRAMVIVFLKKSSPDEHSSASETGGIPPSFEKAGVADIYWCIT